MKNTDHIIIKGLYQNNLKHISFEIPKNKIVVFTGVSGSGKSSIVFDTVAAESSRQMNETYTAWVRGRLPKYRKPKVDLIENLTPSVIVDQSRLGGNIRSTVGTISDMYASLRLLFSRIGVPHAGSASFFSFNDPNGMCPECSGIGKKTVINLKILLDPEKSLNEGCITDAMMKPGSWYWNQYAESGLFDLDKKLKDYSKEEYNLLLYGNRNGQGERENKHVEGVFNQYTRYYLKRDLSNMSSHHKNKSEQLVIEEQCPLCLGKRLNLKALASKINGYSIHDMCEMEFVQLKDVLCDIKDSRVTEVVEALVNSLTRMIEIGLPYLNMNRESSTLSGGEAQRLKLVRYMGSSLTGMTYIFDEPSTGMHPRDVYRMNRLLKELRDKGNTVLVVEHDKDVISIADYVIDVGPLAGEHGGTIVFEGTYDELLQADTLTAKAMKISLPLKSSVRKPTGYLPVRGANLHNLKNVDVDIPLGVMCTITGVAGSGKSSLISGVFANEYEDRVIKVDQSAITATNRSMPVTFLGIFDEIRQLFATENGVDAGMLSFNSQGACPYCKGKGVIETELVFMDPIITECEACGGTRYSKEALSYRYKGKSVIEVLDLTITEAMEFFDSNRIKKVLSSMQEVGLSYLKLGQPTSTLSGGERQRLKLAKYMKQKGNIYLLDEPTTGLHPSDIEKLVKLFERFVNRGNTVLIIEHNMDIMKQSDYIIDVGPDGGKNGGEVVFTGTPREMIEHSDTITAQCLRNSL
jgi:excinuclease UvrABC ATPase subunit